MLLVCFETNQGKTESVITYYITFCGRSYQKSIKNKRLVVKTTNLEAQTRAVTGAWFRELLIYKR